MYSIVHFTCQHTNTIQCQLHHICESCWIGIIRRRSCTALAYKVKPKPRRNRFTALTRAPGKSSVHMGASCCHISRCQNVPWIAIAWHWNKSCLHELYIDMLFFDDVDIIQISSVRTLLLCQGDLEIWR